MKYISSRQKKILEFCKDTPRYGWEIAKYLYGDNFNGHSHMQAIWGLAKRGLLLACSAPDNVVAGKYKWEKKRKYYIANPEFFEKAEKPKVR